MLEVQQNDKKPARQSQAADDSKNNQQAGENRLYWAFAGH